MDNDRQHKAIRFLRWFCRPEFLDEIEGDIIELYEIRIDQTPDKAGRLLWWDVIRSFRWINLKKVNTQNYQFTMFANYCKIGVRNLVRDYKFSLLNLVGLSLGLTIFLMMIMMIDHEHGFDTFHEKADRTFQIIQEFRQSDGADPEIWTPRPLAEVLENEASGVDFAIAMQGASSNWVTVNDKRFFEQDGMIVGRNFFDIFDFKLISGDPNVVLKAPRSTVISKRLSRKYFGFENAIGKVIEHEFYGPFTVTGVLQDVPGNSYLQFDYLLTEDLETYFENVATWYPEWYKSWEGHGVSTFVVLNEDAEAGAIESQVKEIVSKHLKTDDTNNFYLLGLLDLHFSSNGIDGRINQHIKGDRDKVNLFVVIAIVILLMACFNYVNITTARAIKRNKEVGVRKVIGAFRSQLVIQFLIESLLIVIAAALLSLVLCYLFVPLFRNMVGINLEFSGDLILSVMPWILLTVMTVSAISGLYPAIILSGTSPLTLVQKMINGKTNSNVLRNGLVTLQFIAVIVICACLFIVNGQYKYMSEKSLGFNTEEILVVEINSGTVRNNYQTIKTELIAHTGVKAVTGVTRVFNGYRSPVSIIGKHVEDPDTKVAMKFYGIDQEALDVFGMQLVAGEGFKGIPSLDSASILLNEKAAEKFGGTEIIGQWIALNEDEGDHRAQLTAQVIGIVKDFHFESLHQPIKPTVIGHYATRLEALDDIIIQIDGGDIQATLNHIEEVHNRYDTNDIMDWEFLDEMTQRAYEDEVVFRNVMTAASIISLIIALLGMIGMISYSIISRTKEFGIRKVLGASLGQLFIGQGQSFLKYLILASLIATPLSWNILSDWLNTYAFRIQLTPVPFLMIITLLMGLTGLTVYLLGRSTFRQNPTKALRYE